MKVFRTFALMLVCSSLVLSNVANASMMCCIMGGDSMAQAQPAMDHAVADMEMPCHEMAEAEQQDANSCDNCDCQHCMKISLLSVSPEIIKNRVEVADLSYELAFYSNPPSALLQPPRRLS